MKITDREIERAEALLLPAGCHFDEERRAFIRCMESRDVVACPGSGKTTALVAKLMILAGRMPFPDGRGVCVLTHTNMAIDLIRSRSGAAAHALFHHPNYLGTIQGFTNQFLAIPAYVGRFGRREIRMDEDLYAERARTAFFDHGLQKSGVIYAQLKRQLDGLAWEEQLPLKIEFFKKLQFRFEGDLVHYASGNTGKTIMRGDGSGTSYPAIHAARYGLLEEGYLRYEDAYPLAMWYAQENPMLCEAFRHRFAWIFVDEAQDTDAVQLAVLDAAFTDCPGTLKQSLGDPNQAIYSLSVKKEQDWRPKAKPLHFSNTLRYGESIARVLNTVRIDSQISLKPHPARDSLPPRLLTFGDGEEPLVLPAFVELLRSHGLDKPLDGKAPVLKAVGWVGKDRKDEGKLCLRSYFEDYSRESQGRREHFSSLLAYVQHQSPGNARLAVPREYRNAILEGITRAMKIADKRHPDTGRAFTPTSLLRWLWEGDESDYHQLLSLLSGWVHRLACHEETLKQLRDVRDDVAEHLQDKWFGTATGELKAFLTSAEGDTSGPEREACTIYEEGDIEVEVGTVHSVKGQTHTATLYVETYYQRSTDSVRLLPFLRGEYPGRELGKARHIETLKIAHVAMSRPTHLLAVACQKSTIEGNEEALKQRGWVIVPVADARE